MRNYLQLMNYTLRIENIDYLTGKIHLLMCIDSHIDNILLCIHKDYLHNLYNQLRFDHILPKLNQMCL